MVLVGKEFTKHWNSLARNKKKKVANTITEKDVSALTNKQLQSILILLDSEYKSREVRELF